MRHFTSLCACLVLTAAAAPAALPAQTLTFAPAKVISTGEPSPVGADVYLTGNFRGNGNTDLVVEISAASGTTYKYLTGDGSGNFSITGPVSLGNQTASVVADVNGDGKDDIVTLLGGCPTLPCSNNPANSGDADGIFTVLLSDGNGKFTPGFVSTLPSGLPYVEGIAGDFNHDGKPDIAVLATDKNLSPAPAQLIVFLNQGDGTFTQTSYSIEGLETEPEVTNLVAGDFAGNGNQDLGFLYLAAGTPTTLDTFAGDGSGNFATAVESYGFDSQFYYTNPRPQLFAADLNGDGRSDVLTLIDTKNNGTKPRVPTILSEGSGKFYWFSAVSLYTHSPTGIILTDLNGDGKPDLAFIGYGAVPGSNPALGGVYLGLGNGAFQTPHIPLTFNGPPDLKPAISAAPLKTGDLPSLIITIQETPDLQLLVNTTHH